MANARDNQNKGKTIGGLLSSAFFVFVDSIPFISDVIFVYVYVKALYKHIANQKKPKKAA